MITLEDVRDEEQFAPGDEGKVQRIIDRTIALWETQTGRLWKRRTCHTQLWTLRTPEKRSARNLWTKLRPIETMTLKEWQINEAESSADLLAPNGDDYQLLGDEGKIIRVGAAAWGEFVKAEYTGGYIDSHQKSPPIGAAVVPDDVVEALVIQVIFRMRRHRGDRLIMSSQAFEAGSTNFLSADQHPIFKQAVKARRRRAYAGF